MINLKIENLIDKQKIKAIALEKSKQKAKSIAEKIYQESQANVPVKTGQLKDSGYIKDIAGGYEVGYTVDYAEYVDKKPQALQSTGNVTHFLSGPFAKYKALNERGGSNDL